VLAKEFLRVAKADNPLQEAVRHREVSKGLGRMIRRRWVSKRRGNGRITVTSLRNLEWDQLNDGEQKEIREMARRLARFHESRVHHGPRIKGELDALTHGLAEIFLSEAGFGSLERMAVPYSVEAISFSSPPRPCAH
jgi:hypothetical protein